MTGCYIFGADLWLFDFTPVDTATEAKDYALTAFGCDPLGGCPGDVSASGPGEIPA